MPGYPSRCEGYLATHHWSLNFQNITNEHSLSTRTLFRVHPSFGVGTVWRGIRASGGWRCLPSLGETQCVCPARPHGEIRQLGRVRGQAHGWHLRRSDGTGRDVVGLNSFDMAPVTNRDTRSARQVVGEGALRGRSPRTREGLIGPTAQNCSGQWSVVSGQRGRYLCRRGEGEIGVAMLLTEAWESSAPFGEAPAIFAFGSRIGGPSVFVFVPDSKQQRNLQLFANSLPFCCMISAVCVE